MCLFFLSHLQHGLLCLFVCKSAYVAHSRRVRRDAFCTMQPHICVAFVVLSFPLALCKKVYSRVYQRHIYFPRFNFSLYPFTLHPISLCVYFLYLLQHGLLCLFVCKSAYVAHSRRVRRDAYCTMQAHICVAFVVLSFLLALCEKVYSRVHERLVYFQFSFSLCT